MSAQGGRREELREEIRSVRRITDRPFAVNINLFPTMRPFPIEQMIDVAHQEGVRILETSGRSPEPYMERLKEGGMILIHKCARVRDAVKALRNQTAQEILEMEAGGASLEELLPKLSGLKGKAAYEKGDVNEGVFPCGQVAGLVKEVPPGKRGPRDMSSAPPGGSTLMSSASGSARIIPP